MPGRNSGAPPLGEVFSGGIQRNLKHIMGWAVRAALKGICRNCMEPALQILRRPFVQEFNDIGLPTKR